MKNSTDDWAEYESHIQRALSGEQQSALEGLLLLLQRVSDVSLRARLLNDTAVLKCLEGRVDEAACDFAAATALTPGWMVPEQNRQRLTIGNAESRVPSNRPRSTRVAIISLLFNWPSTGGGTVHTAETGKFLSRAGYEVRHIYAEFSQWGVGTVTEPTWVRSEPLRFTPEEWAIASIQSRFKAALDAFQPDWVIVTDSWNSKPILAEAAQGYRFLLRIAAQECLCPLNNVRLLFENDRFISCPKLQLATPNDCCDCVFQRGKFSGALHQAERELSGYGTQEYDRRLHWAFANAEAVLVVNPLLAAMVGPYAKRVCVIPSGFDSDRFPECDEKQHDRDSRLRLLFAGLVNEPMKGFEVLLEASRQLWMKRQDFELLATADPPGRINAFTQFVGWQSQSNLPQLLKESDIIVFPTVAEEALGRSAVEAMAAGRPVIASRIGGLQFTVADGATGLLFEPGNVRDLKYKLERLLDDEELRHRMGNAGRQRFLDNYTWESVLKNHYLPLLGPPHSHPAAAS